MQNKEINNYETIQRNQDSEEYTIKFLKNTFLRNKIFIASFVSLTTFTGILFSYIEKPLYKGNFQIFISNKNETQNVLGKFLEEEFKLPIKNLESNNKTQEFILRSPSVLKPVFNFVKGKYEKNGIDVKELSYKSWIKNTLKVEFETGTNILTIDFIDKDKNLILDTLNLISKKYQDYSRRDKIRTLTKTINHLEEQKTLFTKKARISRKELNEFTIENGLGSINGLIVLEEKSPRDSQLNVNQKNPTNFQQRYQPAFTLLAEYEKKYADGAAFFKPNSDYLQNLAIKIESLKSSLKRPNEILIKHKDLINKATRDEGLLNKIEETINLTNLEIAKQQDPWELISEPTIDDQRVSPRRTRRTITFFLGSLIFSFFLVQLKEKRSGIVFEIEDLKNNLKIPYLDKIFSNNLNLSQQIISNISKKLDLGKKSNIGFLSLSNNESSINYNFFEEFISLSQYKKISLEEINKFEKVILFAEKGKVNYKTLNLINAYINVYKSKFVGWVLIDNVFTFK